MRAIRNVIHRPLKVQLQSEAEGLKQMLEYTSTAYCLLDGNATVIAFNPAAEKMTYRLFGKHLLKGVNFIVLVQETLQVHTQKLFETALATGVEQSTQCAHQSIDGSDLSLFLKIHPILKNGVATSANVMIADITEAAGAEPGLDENHRRYELLMRATCDVVWDWNIVKNQVYRSSNYGELFGYHEPEVQSFSTHWAGRIHPEDRDAVIGDLMEKVSATGDQSWHADYRYLREDGSIAHIRDRGYLLRDAQGKAVRMVGAMRDITENKLLQLQFQHVTEDLIRQKRHIEQFAYMISHNLRAPVANLLGLCAILDNPKVDQETRNEMLPKISTAVKSVDEIINDMNQVFHIKNDMLRNREKIGFDDLVNDVKNTFGPMLKSSGFDIVTQFDVPEIYSIKAYFHSIFFNLVSNSIKYRRTGMPSFIRISSFKSENRLFLVFADNGAGIDLSAHGNDLFGLYKRFHFITKGRGMGLFIVKAQVESLGGVIHVKSKVGEGTTFTIEFNLKRL